MGEKSQRFIDNKRELLRWKYFSFILFTLILCLLTTIGYLWNSLLNCDTITDKDKTAATKLQHSFRPTDKVLKNHIANEVTTTTSETTNNYLEGYKIISRKEWGARDASEILTDLELPIDKFIIAHTNATECFNQAECSIIVKQFQQNHIIVNKFSDIAYNFLIGSDGNIYEGRGWLKVGAHTFKSNQKSIGVAYIGDFTTKAPNEVQINAGFALFEEGVKLGYVKEDYKIFGQRQLRQTESPGKAFYEIIQQWDHWSSNIK